MALKFSTSLKNVIVNDIIVSIAGTYGTAGTGNLNVYNGSQPADADSATNGTLLVTLANVNWEQCTGGTSALNAAVNGTTVAAGTAAWARFEWTGAAATHRLDGNVGTAGTEVFVLNNAVFATAGGVVSLLSGPLYMG